MTTNAKRALLIFGGGVLLFWAFKKIKPFGSTTTKKIGSSSSSSSTATPKQLKDAALIVEAYSAAKAAGEPQSFLDNMNTQFATQYGMRVYTNKGDGTLFAADLQGTKIS